MHGKQLDRDLYLRATLPLNWTGKRTFTRQEWAQIVKFLKQYSDKTLADYLEENGMQ